MFAFAVDDGRPSPEGTAPLAVQARQIPRLVVSRLNAGEDRRLRFFPFMGVVAGKRQFYELDERFPVDDLRKLHGQAAVGLLVDGLLSVDRLRIRVFDAERGADPKLELDLEYDPVDPWPAVRHFAFELTGLLDRQVRMPDLPDWTGPLLGWFLIAKDEQIAIEAGFPLDDVSQRLRAAQEALLLAPERPEIVETFLASCRLLAARDIDRPGVARVVEAVLDQVELAPAQTAACATVVEACRGLAAAVPLYHRAAQADASLADAVTKAGFGLHASGRTRDALDLLRRAEQAGVDDPGLLAQLAAAEEECGDPRRRDTLLLSLADRDALPVPVARLVASYLVDHDRAVEAIALIDRVAPKVVHAGLLLERGRALLFLRRTEEACQSLQRCLAVEATQQIRSEARRLLRLAADPALLPHIRALEAALRDGDQQGAARLARALVRQRPQLAEAWLLLGVVRQRGEQPRRAIRAFRRALNLQDDLSDAHNRLGVLLLQRGNEVESFDHLRRATELSPNDSSAWIHLAQACLHLGRSDDALGALDRAERLGGHEDEVAEVRAMFRDESA